MIHGRLIGMYARVDDIYIGPHWVPLGNDTCWKCGQPTPDLAHMIHEYVAAVLGAELERRIWAEARAHEQQHGCGRQGWWPNCPDVRYLWALLPDWMQPVAYA
jgi:hypothetical protein